MGSSLSVEIPQEIVEYTLSMLPPKALLRCRCVCKAWYSLISSPDFLKAHLCRARQKPYLLFRHIPQLDCVFSNNAERYSLVHDTDPFNLIWQLDDSPFNGMNFLRLVGSIDGLCCLHDRATVILWNLSLRKYVQLPLPNVTLMTHGAYCATVGFGYDALTDDYKVVRIMNPQAVYLEEVVKVKAEVISLSKMELGWRNVSTDGLAPNIYDDAWQLFLNGICHWFARQASVNLIVSFDIRSETFGKISLPVQSNADSYWTLQTERNCFYFGVNSPRWNLVEYKGMLGLTDHEFDKEYSLWVMNEYGNAESWTKVFTINMDKCWLPVGFRSSGEVLMFERRASSSPQSTDHGEGDEVVTYNMNLVSFDHSTSETRVLRTCNVPAPNTFSLERNNIISKSRRKCKFPKIVNMSYYVESLILLEDPAGALNLRTGIDEGPVALTCTCNMLLSCSEPVNEH